MHNLDRGKLLLAFGYVDATRESFEPPQDVRESLIYPEQRAMYLKRLTEKIINSSEKEDTGFYSHNFRDIVGELTNLLAELNDERKAIASDFADEMMQLVSLTNEFAQLKVQVLSIEDSAELREFQRRVIDGERLNLQSGIDEAIGYLDFQQ